MTVRFQPLVISVQTLEEIISVTDRLVFRLAFLFGSVGRLENPAIIHADFSRVIFYMIFRPIPLSDYLMKPFIENFNIARKGLRREYWIDQFARMCVKREIHVHRTGLGFEWYVKAFKLMYSDLELYFEKFLDLFQFGNKFQWTKF